MLPVHLYPRCSCHGFTAILTLHPTLPVMDPLAGGLAAVLVVACYLTSNLWVAGGGAATVAAAVHVLAWAAQIYGHGVHEGRAPALLDNLFQVHYCIVDHNGRCNRLGCADDVPCGIPTCTGLWLCVLAFGRSHFDVTCSFS